MASTLNWESQGVHVAQASGFPDDPTATTVITVTPDAGRSPTFTLAIRVPFWANRTNVVTVNGAPWSTAPVAGTYLRISRSWAAGDVVSVLYTPYIRWEQLNDDRPAWAGVGAILYGSILLAGITDTDSLPIDPAGIEAAVTRVAGPTLAFNFKDGCGTTVSLMPLADVMNERYTVYFRTGAGGGTVGYNASGSVLPGATQDFSLGGGSGIVTNGPGVNIRSGDPGQTTLAVWRVAAKDVAPHRVTGATLSYQYVAGYGADGAPGGATLSLVATQACGVREQILYTSPALEHYPYDQCNTCYSPPQIVNLPRGSFNVDVANATTFEIRFVNNNRNVQILLPLPLTLFWD